jgi:hypothetical protein
VLADVQFSLPLWPGLHPTEIEKDVLPVLFECKDVISDLYFTCRIPPFDGDAMGGIIVPEEKATVINNAFVISQKLEIPLSATFNDVTLNPNLKNYKTFVKHFQPIYDAGVDIVTIPNTAWLAFGLKKEFPDLFVKNTILNRVQTPAQVASLFESGFDYINLDRELMRDERSLREIHEAKTHMEQKLGKKLYISLLYNEGCEANCPIHADHYAYNLNRTIDDPSYFDGEMRDISPCIIKQGEIDLWHLKSASIPSYYSELERLSQYVDVFKMHGRESRTAFYETLEIVRQFKHRKLIDDPFRKILKPLPERDRKIWLKTIRNCRFNCWKCHVCEDTIEKVRSLDR